MMTIKQLIHDNHNFCMQISSYNKIKWHFDWRFVGNGAWVDVRLLLVWSSSSSSMYSSESGGNITCIPPFQSESVLPLAEIFAALLRFGDEPLDWPDTKYNLNIKISSNQLNGINAFLCARNGLSTHHIYLNLIHLSLMIWSVNKDPNYESIHRKTLNVVYTDDSVVEILLEYILHIPSACKKNTLVSKTMNFNFRFLNWVFFCAWITYHPFDCHYYSPKKHLAWSKYW